MPKKEIMIPVMVRMTPSFKRRIMRAAKREEQSFGEFVREGVGNHAEVMSRWVKIKPGRSTLESKERG